MRTSSAARGVAAVVALLALVVAVPALLLAASTARFGHAAPLHGLDAPWRWTLDSARSWWHRLTDQLDTSAELIDLFLHLAVVLAWVCVVVIVVTVIGEVAYQLRHGMPSSGHRNVLGLAWLGRVVAGGLVALVPLTASMPALATGGSTSARSAAPASVDGVDVPPPTARRRHRHRRRRPPTVAMPGAEWSTYVVQRGDSVWSIAGAIAGPSGDVDAVAGQIVDANRGATMADGRRFTTPALIEPGWHLAVPGSPAGAAPCAGSSGGAGAARRRRRRLVLAHRHRGPRRHLGDGAVGRRRCCARTEALIDLNAPRLGHDDPALIVPGETVELLGAASDPGSDATVAPTVDDGAPGVRVSTSRQWTSTRRRLSRWTSPTRPWSRRSRSPGGDSAGRRRRDGPGGRRRCGAADGCRTDGRARHRPARVRAAGVGRRGGRRDHAAVADEQRRRPGGHCRCNDRGRLGRAGGARPVRLGPVRHGRDRSARGPSSPAPARRDPRPPDAAGTGDRRSGPSGASARSPHRSASPASTWRCASPRPTSPRSGPACSPSKRSRRGSCA